MCLLCFVRDVCCHDKLAATVWRKLWEIVGTVKCYTHLRYRPDVQSYTLVPELLLEMRDTRPRAGKQVSDNAEHIMHRIISQHTFPTPTKSLDKGMKKHKGSKWSCTSHPRGGWINAIHHLKGL